MVQNLGMGVATVERSRLLAAWGFKTEAYVEAIVFLPWLCCFNRAAARLPSGASYCSECFCILDCSDYSRPWAVGLDFALSWPKRFDNQ